MRGPPLMTAVVDRVLSNPVVVLALRIATGLEAGPHIHPDGVAILSQQIADLVADDDPIVARACRLCLLEVIDDDELLLPGPARSWQLIESGGGGD